MTAQNTPTHGLLCRVVSDVLGAPERGDSLPDLTEAVKQRCARLRLVYDATAIAKAVDAVMFVRTGNTAPGSTSR